MRRMVSAIRSGLPQSLQSTPVSSITATQSGTCWSRCDEKLCFGMSQYMSSRMAASSGVSQAEHNRSNNGIISGKHTSPAFHNVFTIAVRISVFHKPPVRSAASACEILGFSRKDETAWTAFVEDSLS